MNRSYVFDKQIEELCYPDLTTKATRYTAAPTKDFTKDTKENLFMVPFVHTIVVLVVRLNAVQFH